MSLVCRKYKRISLTILTLWQEMYTCLTTHYKYMVSILTMQLHSKMRQIHFTYSVCIIKTAIIPLIENVQSATLIVSAVRCAGDLMSKKQK